MAAPYALQERPILAARIGIITVTWSEIERLLGMLLADMLGSDKPLGMSIYLGMQSEGPQRTIIKTVAEAKMPPEVADRVNAHLASVRDSSPGRNKVVHGVWGIANELPDALIRVETKAYLARYGQPMAPADDVALAGPDMEVWRDGDFRPIQKNLIGLLGRSAALNTEVLAHLYGSP